MDKIQISDGLQELFELFPTPPKGDLNDFLVEIQQEQKVKAIRKSKNYAYDFYLEQPLKSGKYSWKEDELLNYCSKISKRESIVNRNSVFSTCASIDFEEDVNQLIFSDQMGAGYHSKLCSSRLPDQERMIVIPQYLCVNIIQGAIVEYTVGTSSVTGVHVKFDFGDGFCATPTCIGTVITGGLQSQSAWVWTGSYLENLPQMSQRYQRHCAIGFENSIVVISGIHSKGCEIHSLGSQEWEEFGALSVQRSNATTCYVLQQIFVCGGIDSSGKLLTSIEYHNGNQWSTIPEFALQHGLRNAGAIPLRDEFLIFGGSSRPEISCDAQPVAWRVSAKSHRVEVFDKVHISGSFSPYQATIRDQTAAIFSEDGKLYHFDFTKLTFSVPDFIETPQINFIKWETTRYQCFSATEIP